MILNKMKETCSTVSKKITSLPKSEKMLFAGAAALLLVTILAIAIPGKADEVSATPPSEPPEIISVVETESTETEETVLVEETIATIAPEVTEAPTEEVTEATEPVTEPPAETTAPEKTPTNTSNTSKPATSNNTWDVYVGRFAVPSVGINVGCYNSGAQATVDASDSAAYFHEDGHMMIADHVDQSFSSLKSTSVGAKATLTANGTTKEYTCVGKINGHNTGTAITDADYNSISSYYPGALVAYTCNGNWNNITIVFFMPDEGNNLYMDSDGKLNEFENADEETNHVTSRFCDDLGRDHQWGPWGREWGDDAGTFEWRSRHCKLCPEEDWQLFDLVPPETEPAPTEPEPEPTLPPVTEPPVTEPPVETTPPTEPPAETIPPETEETAPPVDTGEVVNPE